MPLSSLPGLGATIKLSESHQHWNLRRPMDKTVVVDARCGGAVGAPTLLQPSKSTEKVGDDPVAIQMPLHAPSLCKTPPFYRQDYRHISWLRRVYWALALTVAFGGIFWPWFGLVIMPIMLGLMVLGFFRGREWCGNFCDRGALMDGPLRMLHQKFFALPLIRRSPDTVGQIPEVIKHPGLRVLVFAVLITFFVSRVVMACASCEDFEGPEFWKKIAMIGSRMWLISVSMVIGMGILFGPRAFCYVCPMGTMQIAVHWVHHVVLGKNSNKCEPMVTLVDPDACLKCGQCTRVCPMQLDVHNEFDEKGQLRNVDCIKCGSCVWYCAQQILEFRAPGFNEHPNPRDSMNAPAPAKQATLVDIEDLSRDCRKFKFRTVDGKGLAGGRGWQRWRAFITLLQFFPHKSNISKLGWLPRSR